MGSRQQTPNIKQFFDHNLSQNLLHMDQNESQRGKLKMKSNIHRILRKQEIKWYYGSEQSENGSSIKSNNEVEDSKGLKSQGTKRKELNHLKEMKKYISDLIECDLYSESYQNQEQLLQKHSKGEDQVSIKLKNIQKAETNLPSKKKAVREKIIANNNRALKKQKPFQFEPSKKKKVENYQRERLKARNEEEREYAFNIKDTREKQMQQKVFMSRPRVLHTPLQQAQTLPNSPAHQIILSPQPKKIKRIKSVKIQTQLLTQPSYKHQVLPLLKPKIQYPSQSSKTLDILSMKKSFSFKESGYEYSPVTLHLKTKHYINFSKDLETQSDLLYENKSILRKIRFKYNKKGQSQSDKFI